MISWRDLPRLRTQSSFGSCNGGWAYDAYPDLEPLNAKSNINIANISGPAVITNFHSTQHFISHDKLSSHERKALAARGIILEIYYNDSKTPSVMVPLGDFFADGCNGKAMHFTTPFVEKAPESYNCFIPMPFEGSARVMLRNDTPYNFANYSFVEFEKLPTWDKDLGYFHATWKRFAFQLHGKTDEHFFHIDGCGHLIGRAWSVCTDEPLFNGFSFVMEGNNEVRIDGSENPVADYLGTEDSFGFSWGFQKPFAGVYNGINFIQNETPSMLSIYRFHGANAIRFNSSFDLRVDWSHEFKNNKDFQKRLEDIYNQGNGWIDYATTYYWYQKEIGFQHEPLLPLDERVKEFLKSNKHY